MALSLKVIFCLSISLSVTSVSHPSTLTADMAHLAECYHQWRLKPSTSKTVTSTFYFLSASANHQLHHKWQDTLLGLIQVRDLFATFVAICDRFTYCFALEICPLVWPLDEDNTIFDLCDILFSHWKQILHINLYVVFDNYVHAELLCTQCVLRTEHIYSSPA